MSIAAINFTSVTTAQQRLLDAASALRDARRRFLQQFSALDQMRDAGAVTAFLAGKLGCADATEAGKLFDEASSLNGYVASEGANTFGAALLQFCAKTGV